MNPYIYTVVEKEKLKELIEAFNVCLNLPIQVLDENGNVLEACNNQFAYCKHFLSNFPCENTCKELHAKAGERAMTLGETYIFSCHANLNHIVFPLINKQALFGSILVGPFLMDTPDSVLIMDLAKRYPEISTEHLLTLYDDASQLMVVPPAKVTQISRLLYYLFLNLVSDAKEQLIIKQNILHQQAKISESIQMYKTLEPVKKNTYPYEKEQELLLKVKTSNTKEARALLNDLLGYVFFAEGNSIEMVKNRSVELCSLLSRAAIEGGASTDQILKINNEYLKNLQTIDNLENLCFTLDEVLNIFIECMFPTISKSSDLIRKAMKYISNNFAADITLEEVAEHVHLNPTYFSSLFKQSSGTSFKEYLNTVRIEESKRLLANTDYSMIDIAVATGFEDQSYFSKTFKRYTGLTPKQYRS